MARRLGAVSITRSTMTWMVIEPHGDPIHPARDMDGRWIKEKSDEYGEEIHDLEEAIERAASLFQKFKCDHVSISCFGPFKSISRSSTKENSYSVISENQTVLNASGKNIIEIFCRNFQGTSSLITDANSVALGEIVRRFKRAEFPFSNLEEEVKRNAFNRTVVVALIFGKGVGGGIAFGDTAFQFNYHPEIGHIPIAPMPGERKASVCLHKDCISGFASAEAFDRDQNGLPTVESLDRFAYYAAQLCAIVTYSFGPDAIALAGSTMRAHPYVLDRIRSYLWEILRNRTADGGQWHAYIPQENVGDEFVSLAAPESYLFGTVVHALSPVRRYRST